MLPENHLDNLTEIDRAPSEFKVVVIMPVYNEEDIIEVSIMKLLNQGIHVYLIENWSSDETYEIIKKINHKRFLGFERFPKDGHPKYFNWKDILRREEQITREIEANWFMHNDVDTVRISPWKNLSLKDSIFRIDQLGFNAISYIDLIFHPVDNNFIPRTDFELYFKYFEVSKHPANRLQIQAWKNFGQPISFADSGSHQVKFEGRNVSPYRFIMKHYPIRSQIHGEMKIFRDRHSRWNPEERSKGWHTHYDHIKKGHNFLYSPAQLEVFSEDQFQKLSIPETTENNRKP